MLQLHEDTIDAKKIKIFMNHTSASPKLWLNKGYVLIFLLPLSSALTQTDSLWISHL